jgi:hypothetical protein
MIFIVFASKYYFGLQVVMNSPMDIIRFVEQVFLRMYLFTPCLWAMSFIVFPSKYYFGLHVVMNSPVDILQDAYIYIFIMRIYILILHIYFMNICLLITIIVQHLIHL